LVRLTLGDPVRALAIAAAHPLPKAHHAALLRALIVHGALDLALGECERAGASPGGSVVTLAHSARLTPTVPGRLRLLEALTARARALEDKGPLSEVAAAWARTGWPDRAISIAAGLEQPDALVKLLRGLAPTLVRAVTSKDTKARVAAVARILKRLPPAAQNQIKPSLASAAKLHAELREALGGSAAPPTKPAGAALPPSVAGAFRAQGVEAALHAAEALEDVDACDARLELAHLAAVTGPRGLVSRVLDAVEVCAPPREDGGDIADDINARGVEIALRVGLIGQALRFALEVPDDEGLTLLEQVGEAAVAAAQFKAVDEIARAMAHHALPDDEADAEAGYYDDPPDEGADEGQGCVDRAGDQPGAETRTQSLVTLARARFTRVGVSTGGILPRGASGARQARAAWAHLAL
jgi:hypothetical protein